MDFSYDVALTDAPAFVKDAMASVEKGDVDAAMSLATDNFVQACKSSNVASKCYALLAIAKIQLASGDYSDAKAIIEKALADSGSGDDKLKGAMQNTAASVYAALGQTQKALGAVAAAEGHYKGKGQGAEASVLNTRACVCLAGGKKADAIKVSKQAVQLFKEAKVKEGEAAALFMQMKALLSRQKFEEALRSANELLGLYEGSDSVEKEAAALLAVADCRAALDEPEEGQEKALKAAGLFEDARMFSKQAAALMHLGKLCIKSNNAIDGWAYMKEAQDLSRRVGNRKVEAEVMMELALSHAGGGNFSEMQNFSEEGIKICRDGGDSYKSILAAFLTGMCTAYQQQEASGFAQDQQLNWKARTCGKEALSLFQELSNPLGQAKALLALGGAFLGYGNVLEARAKAKEAAEICMDIGDKGLEGMSWLLIAQSKIYENKEEAQRLASVGHKACRESLDKTVIADAEAIVDFIKTFTGEGKGKKEKVSKGPKQSDVQSEKTDIMMDVDYGKQRGAHWFGFTARTARMRAA